MFEKKYRGMNTQIKPDKALIDNLVELTNDRKRMPKPRTNLLRKLAIGAAVMLVCTFTVVPALAGNTPLIYQLMYAVSPATAQFFIPVQVSHEDNGIRMEVVATYIHENTAKIYITIQDLTGDRVDETTDLYDSYSINRPFGGSANCERVGYDAATKTVTFLITISEWGNRKIEGSKMTFSVRNFLSNKRSHSGVLLDVNLGKVVADPNTQTVAVGGGGGVNYEKYRPSNGFTKVLVPSEGRQSPVAGIDITGIGFVDGKLHIQTAVKDRLKNDNHAYFTLKDRDGKERLYDYSVHFIEYSEPGNENTRVDFNEYVFDVAPSQIAEYTLYGSFFTSGLYTEGRWQVTFPIHASTGEAPMR